MSIFLIGMRGAGKTSCGMRAAELIGASFLDADGCLEQEAGRSVAEIFRDEGEAAFRTLEREVTLDLLRLPDAVIATGGGCVLDPELREALGQQEGVIWLRADAAELSRRVRAASTERPSLTGAPPWQELPEILARREPHYLACARRTVDTGNRTVEEVALVLQQLWRELPHHHLR